MHAGTAGTCLRGPCSGLTKAAAMHLGLPRPTTAAALSHHHPGCHLTPATPHKAQPLFKSWGSGALQPHANPAPLRSLPCCHALRRVSQQQEHEEEQRRQQQEQLELQQQQRQQKEQQRRRLQQRQQQQRPPAAAGAAGAAGSTDATPQYRSSQLRPPSPGAPPDSHEDAAAIDFMVSAMVAAAAAAPALTSLSSEDETFGPDGAVAEQRVERFTAAASAVLGLDTPRFAKMLTRGEPPPGARVKNVLVVWCALVDTRNGCVLLAQRNRGIRMLRELYELPGGKVERGEAPQMAAARELEEELGIKVNPSKLVPLGFVSEFFTTMRYNLVGMMYVCDEWEGQPQGREGQDLQWVGPEGLAAFPMPATSQPLVDQLCIVLMQLRGEIAQQQRADQEEALASEQAQHAAQQTQQLGLPGEGLPQHVAGPHAAGVAAVAASSSGQGGPRRRRMGRRPAAGANAKAEPGLAATSANASAGATAEQAGAATGAGAAGLEGAGEQQAAAAQPRRRRRRRPRAEPAEAAGVEASPLGGSGDPVGTSNGRGVSGSPATTASTSTAVGGAGDAVEMQALGADGQQSLQPQQQQQGRRRRRTPRSSNQQASADGKAEAASSTPSGAMAEGGGWRRTMGSAQGSNGSSSAWRSSNTTAAAPAAAAPAGAAEPSRRGPKAAAGVEEGGTNQGSHSLSPRRRLRRPQATCGEATPGGEAVAGEAGLGTSQSPSSSSSRGGAWRRGAGGGRQRRSSQSGGDAAAVGKDEGGERGGGNSGTTRRRPRRRTAPVSQP